jgi:ribosomal biogenesis protein LAS1
VPWSSWAEWRSVRDAIFSPYPAPYAALRRVSQPSSCNLVRAPR